MAIWNSASARAGVTLLALRLACVVLAGCKGADEIDDVPTASVVQLPDGDEFALRDLVPDDDPELGLADAASDGDDDAYDVDLEDDDDDAVTDLLATAGDDGLGLTAKKGAAPAKAAAPAKKKKTPAPAKVYAAKKAPPGKQAAAAKGGKGKARTKGGKTVGVVHKPKAGGGKGGLKVTKKKPGKAPASNNVYRIAAGDIVVGTSDRMAGAVESLIFRGKEMINASDHGRELQIAWQADGRYECDNPTEAGSRDDATGPRSTSKLVQINAVGNVMTTVNQPAYWLSPGEDGGKKGKPAGTSVPCGGARNKTVRSSHTITKTVTIGYQQFPNVVRFDMFLHVAKAATAMRIEAPVAYLVGDLSTHYVFDPATGALSGRGGYDPSDKPIIASNADGSAAIAQIVLRVYGGEHFAYYDLMAPNDGFNIIDAVLYRDATPAGDYHLESFVVLGNHDEVKRTLMQQH
jgi:hypothetical protein